MSAQPSSPEAARRRARVAPAAWGLIGLTGALCLLLPAIGALIEAASLYPNSRRVSDDGVRLVAECPTYGSRVGSVRSPLCRWGISRKALFETNDPLSQVYEWYRSRERAWGVRLGRLAIELSLGRVQPAPQTSALVRFVVETGFRVDLLQR
jgi:hypothetical protein